MAIRLATSADMPTLEKIAITTLKAMYPAENIGESIGLAQQFGRPGVIFACDDPPTVFIWTERDVRWQVRMLCVPLAQRSGNGRALVTFALQQEHALRPFIAATECFARLERASAVETATASGYRILLGSKIRTIRQNAVPVADEIFLTASVLATKLGIVL